MGDTASKIPTVQGGIPNYISNPVYTPTPVTENLDLLKKIPLPWKRKYIENQLILELDPNNYYKISVPTGFYCTLDKKEINSNEPLITKIKFEWKKNKIPIDLLFDFVKASAKVYNKYKSEFAACIFHNTKTDDYELLIPFQTVSGGSVTYSPSEGFSVYNDIENMNCVVDLHSHHTMGIGFSSTDNHSDGIIGAIGSVSLVIKKIDSFNFIDPDKSVDIRFTIQGKNYELKLEDVFDMHDDLFDMADQDFIKISQPVLYNPNPTLTSIYKDKESSKASQLELDLFEDHFGTGQYRYGDL